MKWAKMQPKILHKNGPYFNIQIFKKKLTFPLFVLSIDKSNIGRADAEDKWLKESYPETTSESENDFNEDNDYEPIEPAEHHCSEIEFECSSDRKCIPLDKQCDNQNDCDDNSDESACTTTANPIESETDFKYGNNDVDGSGGQGDGFTGWVYRI